VNSQKVGGYQGQGNPASPRLPLLVGIVVSVLAGLFGATQFFAYQFGGQAALGSNLAGFYPPWRILTWAAAWYANFSPVFMTAAALGMGIVMLGFLGVFILKMVSQNTARAQDTLHGSARWATKADIEAAGLLNNDGVYVGAWREPGSWWRKGRLYYLRDDSSQHVLTYAPPRSGKGVGLVIPTLLSWPHSVVVNDLKGELWELTSGWRKHHAGNKVLRFEPASSTNSISFNPLDAVRFGRDEEVGDAQNIATLIVDPDGKGLKDHWEKSARGIITGCILHLLYKREAEGTPATLSAVDALLSDPDKTIKTFWDELLIYRYANGKQNRTIAKYARDMIDTPEREAGSKISTVKTFLELFRDPVIEANTCRSDVTISDLSNYRDPITLYIISQPADKNRLRPLIRIVINMIARNLSGKLGFEKGRPKPNYKHRLLLMLDEFVSSLGKMEILESTFAYFSSYGVKCYLICQDLNQIKSEKTGYGHDEAITSSCHIENAYPPNRLETARYISEKTGETTVLKTSVTISGKRTGWLGQATRTIQEYKRPLLTSDEVQRLPSAKQDENGFITKPGAMLIFVKSCPAIYGEQILFFKDTIFQARAEIPPPKVSDSLKPVFINSLFLSR
jgi:type IV secretion system protein VirD4